MESDVLGDTGLFEPGLQVSVDHVTVRPLKTSPDEGGPHSARASSLMGIVASVSVFSVQIRIHLPPSGNLLHRSRLARGCH